VGILIRSPSSGGWQAVDSSPFSLEADLRDLIVETPSLVPIEDIREGSAAFIVAVPEFGLPGAGYTDVVLFAPDGVVAVVECKLARNAQIKREVVGQVFEYAAFLWQMPYDDFDQRVASRTGKHIVDLVRDAVSDQAWDEHAFRDGVEAALHDGTFVLVIAVDEINPELDRTVSFLNGCGEPKFSFAALEMRRSQWQDTEILVPHLYGPGIGASATPRSASRVWTRDTFLAAVTEQSPTGVAAVVSDLLDWSGSSDGQVFFGHGTQTGSFTLTCTFANGKRQALFAVYDTGVVAMNLGGFTNRPDFYQRYVDGLAQIPGFADAAHSGKAQPSVRVADALVGHGDALAAFKALIEDLVARATQITNGT